MTTYPIARPQDSDDRSGATGHLIALEQLRRRGTVFSDPRRAGRMLRLLIFAVAIIATGIASFSIDTAFLEALGHVALVMILLALVALAGALTIDLLQQPAERHPWGSTPPSPASPANSTESATADEHLAL